MKILVQFIILYFFLSINIENTYCDFKINALWVPCEGKNKTLDSPEKIDNLIKYASKNKINVLFVQVYRGNRSWFLSEIADDTPAQKFKDKNGYEMLPYLIRKAHKNNIEVHAWFNVLRIAVNKNAPILKKYGRKIITRDSKLRNLLDYPKFKMPSPDNNYYVFGDPGLWLDAGNENVKNYILELIKNFILRYNEIDGIHLDFIRLPIAIPFSPGSRFKGISYGYGYESIKKFREKYGFDPLQGNLTRNQYKIWDNFRREQITNIVKNISNKCTKKYGIKLSAAVRPWVVGAYLVDCQNWPDWLKNGYIDFAVVMNYTDDISLFKYTALSNYAIKKISKSNTKIITGIGIYLLDKKKFKKELSFLEKINADGISIFSYDSILEKGFLLNNLINSKQSY